MSHGDDGAGDLPVLFALRQTVDEAAVDLQYVDGELLEVVQRRIAGAEIVDGDAQAQALEVGEGLHGAGHVLHQRALGQLQFQTGWRNTAVFENRGDARVQITFGELPGREVDRDLRYTDLGRVPAFQLATGFGQDPVTDLHHQPQFFQHRNEVVWRHQSASRVLPAQQGLDAGQALAVAGKLRLVMQDEFVLFQGMAQVAFQFQALQGAGVHVRLIELEVVLAALLGVVHRRVGIFHQVTELIAILWAQGDADTGRDEKFAALEDERLSQAGEYLFGDMNGPVQCALAGGMRLQQHGELIATHARDGVVIVDSGGQADGHILEHAVAGSVAE